MKWTAPQGNDIKVERRFAWIPARIDGMMVWLEYYWSGSYYRASCEWWFERWKWQGKGRKAYIKVSEKLEVNYGKLDRRDLHVSELISLLESDERMK